LNAQVLIELFPNLIQPEEKVQEMTRKPQFVYSFGKYWNQREKTRNFVCMMPSFSSISLQRQKMFQQQQNSTKKKHNREMKKKQKME